MAKDGVTICLGMLTITFMVWALYLFDGRTITLAAGTVSAILTIFFLYFFRDPKRNVPSGENIIVSPADGKVVGIKEIPNHHFLNTSAVQISIFLSPLDVHINRVPASGTISFVKYNKGKFEAAFKDKASELNEHTEIGMITSSGARIVFKQIAGAIARRIVCRLKPDQQVATGEKFGMIKFGSRADLFLPQGTEINIKLGQHITGGETIIGKLKAAASANAGKVSTNQSNA